jgi:hypothetical protein
MNEAPPMQPRHGLKEYLCRDSKQLRRDTSIAPGGEHFDALIHTYLPLVYGTALKLVPEDPTAAGRIALTSFELLAVKWRRVVKTRGGVLTQIANFLLRAAVSASGRERKRLRLKKPARGSEADDHRSLFRHYFRLNRTSQWCVLLYYILKLEDGGDPAKMLKFHKRGEKAFRQLQKKLRKRSIGSNLGAGLAAIPSSAPQEVEAAILDGMRRWTVTAPRAELTRSTVLHWRLLRIGTFFKRALAGVGIVVCILALLTAAFVHLAQRGKLIPLFVWLGKHDTRNKYPELAIPAREWPVTAEDRTRVSTRPPETSAELYAQTNIWVARLSFTPEAWKGIQPTRIEPVPDLFNGGKIVLRNPNAKRSGLAGAIGYDFNWVEAQFEFAGVRFTNVAARYRGNGTFLNSLWGPKQSFKVDLNKFTKKQSIAGIDELNFANSVVDFSYLHDSLAQRLFRDLGVMAPRTAYAYLFVDVPGKWSNQAIGLYNLIENIDKDFAEDRFGTKKVPIFKPVTYELFIDIGEDWESYADIYDLKTEATGEQLQRVIDFAKLVTHASDEEFARRLPEFLDIEEVAAYVAANVLLASYDGFFTNGQNFFMYLDPRSNKFGLISWDQDHSWGGFGHVGRARDRERASIWKPWVQEYDFRFLRRIMEAPVFREAYQKKLETALEHYFTKDRLFAMIDMQAALIRPAVAAENSLRLRRFDIVVSDEGEIGPPSPGGQAEGPAAPPHHLKRFIENRIHSVRAQLDGKEEGVHLGRAFGE